MLGFGPHDLAIEPVVEIMARWTVVKEAEGGKSDESLHIEWSSADEDLKYGDWQG